MTIHGNLFHQTKARMVKKVLVIIIMASTQFKERETWTPQYDNDSDSCSITVFCKTPKSPSWLANELTGAEVGQ